MPKIKTRRAAAKRFRATGSGKKIFRRKAFKNHMLEHKTTERKRRLTGLTLVSEEDEKNVRRMLPYI